MSSKALISILYACVNSSFPESADTGFETLFGFCESLRLALSHSVLLLHGPSMFTVKAKIYRVNYNESSSVGFD